MNLDELDGNFQHLAWLVGAVRLTPHREAATLSLIFQFYSVYVFIVFDFYSVLGDGGSGSPKARHSKILQGVRPEEGEGDREGEEEKSSSNLISKLLIMSKIAKGRMGSKRKVN